MGAPGTCTHVWIARDGRHSLVCTGIAGTNTIHLSVRTDEMGISLFHERARYLPGVDVCFILLGLSEGANARLYPTSAPPSTKADSYTKNKPKRRPA